MEREAERKIKERVYPERTGEERSLMTMLNKRKISWF